MARDPRGGFGGSVHAGIRLYLSSAKFTVTLSPPPLRSRPLLGHKARISHISLAQG